MNSRDTEHNALNTQAANYPAQVQLAGRQLAIAAQLKLDIDRERLVAILKQIAPKDAVTFLSRKQALDGDHIRFFTDQWNWDQLSKNESLPWSIELIERFADHWNWHQLSTNESLPWSIELIERFADHWDWHQLSTNESLPWSIELIECFADRWNWYWLSVNKYIPWSPELIEQFSNRWDWKTLSLNEALPWSLELIETFEDRWDWGKDQKKDEEYQREGLSNNEALPWSHDLIQHFADKWNWEVLSGNKALPWSLELIKRYEDRWTWGAWRHYYDRDWQLIEEGLSNNTSIPWSLDLIEEFDDRWDWIGLMRNKARPWPLELLELLAYSDDTKIYEGAVPESNELIEQHYDRLRRNHSSDPYFWSSYRIEVDEWEWLSSNLTLPWSIDFVVQYAEYWDWWELYNNPAVPWSLDLIDIIDHTEYLDCKQLSKNTNLLWSRDLLQRYEEWWDWVELSKNKSMPWSLELLEQYEDRWQFGDRDGNNWGEPWWIKSMHVWDDFVLTLSIDIVERFKGRWSWKFLSESKNQYLPMLRSADIFEIMEHHFGENILHNASVPIAIKNDEH